MHAHLPSFNPLPSGLRDILIRTTSIKEKDMPTDIWTVNGGMTCAAGGGEQQGARSKLVKPALLGGTAALQIEPGSEPGWVKVTMSSNSPGWLGFGVADPGAFPTPLQAD